MSAAGMLSEGHWRRSAPGINPLGIAPPVSAANTAINRGAPAFILDEHRLQNEVAQNLKECGAEISTALGVPQPVRGDVNHQAAKR